MADEWQTDSERTSRGEGHFWSGGVWPGEATRRDGAVVDSIIARYVERAETSTGHGERGRQHHAPVTGMTDHGVVTAEVRATAPAAAQPPAWPRRRPRGHARRAPRAA